MTKRPERTVHGYRRFRCRDCGKQFNDRTGTVLNRAQYGSDVVALVVLWRLRCTAKVECCTGSDGARWTFGAVRHCTGLRSREVGLAWLLGDAGDVLDPGSDVIGLRHGPDGARLPVKQACRFLADARWLLPPDDASKPGRPRGDWTVNPLLWDVTA